MAIEFNILSGIISLAIGIAVFFGGRMSAAKKEIQDNVSRDTAKAVTITELKKDIENLASLVIKEIETLNTAFGRDIESLRKVIYKEIENLNNNFVKDVGYIQRDVKSITDTLAKDERNFTKSIERLHIRIDNELKNAIETHVKAFHCN